ncbi:MAG TPA: hypothetical protein VFE17_02025 [Candidatus Baltobacteraceae bacterium]|nr:hypothetical protein [Candidatus Baltobacteraceae bacterium]
MIKRLGMFAVAFALAATAVPTMLSAPAGATVTACTPGNNCATANFSLSATVNTYASITASPTTFSWAAVNDNSSTAIQSDGGAQTINAKARTSANSGNLSVYFTAPTSISGSGGNSLNPNTALTFTCSGTYIPYTSSGLGTSTAAGGGTTTAAAVQTGTNLNYCANFAGGASIASTALSLNLLLNAQFLPADTYTSTNGFTVYVSAT